VVVETDFGVKLGIFTCFDILFKSPAQDLAEEGVDGVIFPTMWFSELPFLTGRLVGSFGLKLFGVSSPSGPADVVLRA
jgi:hypothetical protein